MNSNNNQLKIADELVSINERQVNLLDQENTDGESWNYYCTGQIVRPAVFENRISGTIREYLEEFNVEITATNHEISSSCTCSSRVKVCKHVISLLYSWVNDREEFINVGRVVNNLQDLSKIDLVKIIERIIQHNPSNIRFVKRHEDQDFFFDEDEWLDD